MDEDMTKLQNQQVTCEGTCGRTYTCTPSDDIYRSTKSKKLLCITCLMSENGMPEGTKIVEMDEDELR